MNMDGSDVSGTGEFDAEEKDSRKPNERLHDVVGRRGVGGGRGRRLRPGSTKFRFLLSDPHGFID